MSFILDALKKSENERQRTMGPSLADAPVHRQQNERPWWVIAVAALLMVNLVVLVVVLARRDDQPVNVPAAPATQAPVVIPPPATSASQMAVPAAPASTTQRNPAFAPTNPEVRSLAEEADGYYDEDAPLFEHSGPAAAANVPAGRPMVQQLDGPTVAPLPAGATAAPPVDPPANAGDAESVPTISSVIASGVSIPDLHLDIHVYSAQPAERFIFVNMRKYHEGQTLNEGPVIERITPEGAILSYQGRRFLLPRQ